MKLHNLSSVDKLLLVGDIHGDVRFFAQVVDAAVERLQESGIGFDPNFEDCRVLQLGDWGVGWENADPKLLGFPVLMVEGNHEYYPLLYQGVWSRINPNCTHLNRGDVLHLAHDCFAGALGGANSIDAIYRSKGLDWFPEESLLEQTAFEIAAYWKELKEEGKGVSVVFAHDVFQAVFQKTLDFHGRNWKPLKHHFHSRNLQIVFDSIEPKYWFHGHHHIYAKHSWKKSVPFGVEDVNSIETNIYCLDTTSNFTKVSRALEKCVVLVEVQKSGDLRVVHF